MKICQNISIVISAACMFFFINSCNAQTTPPLNIRISATPMHSGQINPMLYGGFIELLDDLVPGMWAEMLNDRDFEGVGVPSPWCYYTGQPGFCDNQWIANSTWSLDKTEPFNGAVSVKLTSASGKPASLAMEKIGVRKGMTCNFSGYFRTDEQSAKATIILKTLLPDGKWTVLASADLKGISKEWKRLTAVFKSTGTTENAIFEVQFKGTGNLWADKLSLMASDNVNGWRKDVVEVIREQKPGIIRWGGSVIDPGNYKWKNGIGDRDKRLPFANVVWGRNDPNDVGIDEFIQFCKAVNAEPLICVCLADGAESARDLVEYCNGNADTVWGKKRTENGHAEPYGVKYWQLGNEQGGGGYSDTCVEFCKQMKQADPNIIILSSFPSPELLQKAGQYIGYTCPHHYTSNLNDCQNSINDTFKIIKDAGFEGKVKIGITEWNCTAGSWGLGRAKLMTLDSIVYTGRYLNLLHRNSDRVELACRSNMTNSFCSGMIETSQLNILKRAPYYVMKLYGDHTKPVPLTVSDVPEQLDVSACRSSDGKSLTVFIVNTAGTQCSVTIDVSQLGAQMKFKDGEIVCDTLGINQVDLMNHWTAPDRIRTIKLTNNAGIFNLAGFSVAAIEYSVE